MFLIFLDFRNFPYTIPIKMAQKQCLKKITLGNADVEHIRQKILTEC